MTTTLLTDTSTARSVQSVAGFTQRNRVYPTLTAVLTTGVILKSNKSNSRNQARVLTIVLVQAKSCRDFMIHSCAPHELWNRCCSVGKRVWALAGVSPCIPVHTTERRNQYCGNPVIFCSSRQYNLSSMLHSSWKFQVFAKSMNVTCHSVLTWRNIPVVGALEDRCWKWLTICSCSLLKTRCSPAYSMDHPVWNATVLFQLNHTDLFKIKKKVLFYN